MDPQILMLQVILVLARTISQQLNCPLNSISSFKLISKRIALKNNILLNKKSFWIYKKLKRNGYIAGKYEVNFSDHFDHPFIKEKVLPKVVEELLENELNFETNYNDVKDLEELLNLSNRNSNNITWEKTLPIYPISPIN